MNELGKVLQPVIILIIRWFILLPVYTIDSNECFISDSKVTPTIVLFCLNSSLKTDSVRKDAKKCVYIA